MAGHLLLVVLLCSFSEMRAQALLPPKLTVNPPMITETDSVTLNCQTPSSVSVSECYFRFVRGGPGKSFPCLQILTGNELLKMSHQSSPAEVKVTCFYLKVHQSPDSDVSSITIRISTPPELTVNPPVITETDSVTLNCQTPSSVSVSQCYFYTLSRGNIRGSSCLQTLTGTELLKMSHQSSPAEVKVICYYTLKLGEEVSPSPHSDTSSITIHSQTPKMSLQRFPGEHVLFTCSLPGSANHDTKCNLYFGESRRPVRTATIMEKRSSKNQWICQFIVTIEDLLGHLRSVQQSDASCDYTLRSEPNSLSPRSDGYSLTDIMEKESHVTQTMTTSIVTTALTVSTAHTSTPVTPATQTSDTDMTSMNPGDNDETRGSSVSTPGTKGTATSRDTASAGKRIWTLAALATGCGVTLGIILMVSAIGCNRRRSVSGSEEVDKQEPENETSDTYHLYSTISEEPTGFALKDMVYSTVQTH
ncbi:uncharacterized protein LOC109140663 [Larimichthys crocea]|uniref:uncharacterized protein LOC109140663 n=1 Tax=Larimichthys crocea TaxID=215358 RepID=UPI000F5E798C|nr:uncharacterized protein LOC109140663 [Larimichthys crocea]